MNGTEAIQLDSASRRLAYIALLGALRELKNSYMENLIMEDKYIVGQGDKAINRMFVHFDKAGFNDNIFYDDMVGKVVEFIEDLRTQVVNILKDNANGGMSQVQEGNDSTGVVEETQA